MQKVLKVLSVIILVFAVLYIATGVMAIVGSKQVAEVATALDGELEQATVSVYAKAAGILAIVAGCLNLLVGCLGFRGANGSKKSLTVAIVLVLLSLILTIYSMIGSVVTWQSIGNLIFPAAFLFVALSVRRTDAAKTH